MGEQCGVAAVTWLVPQVLLAGAVPSLLFHGGRLGFSLELLGQERWVASALVL